MMEKFQNRYRIPSSRLKNWDYGSNAAYFVTCCTKNREDYFGEIQNGKMVLTDIGQHAEKCLREIPDHFPFVKLDNYVVMPDHIHAIIIINKQTPNTDDIGTQNFAFQPNSDDDVGTQNFASLRTTSRNKNRNKFGPQSMNLASIIRGFKIGVTKFSRNAKLQFEWQPRFYDHIIRDKKSFEKIQNYIIRNPYIFWLHKQKH